MLVADYTLRKQVIASIGDSVVKLLDLLMCGS